MKAFKTLMYVTLFCSMAGCTVTGRLHRRQVSPDIEHTTKKQREIVEQTQERQKGYIEYTRADSSKVLLIPTVKNAEGETMMQLDIDEVVVVAKSRSLPERLGKVNIDFVVTLPKELQGKCQSVVVTPVLHKSSGKVDLQDLTIRGGLFSKVQKRNYWQYDTYLGRFHPGEHGRQWAFKRFISYPYPEGVRLDSIVENRETLKYYYTQEVKTDEAGGLLKITLKGKVIALDRSFYLLPLSETLEYSISSMLSFVDTTTRYMTQVIEKYAVVNDRNYLNFPVNRSDIIDTLGNNRQELDRIETLMDEIIRQKEFHIDSIILTASASPEGGINKNIQLSKDRAAALRSRLVKKFPQARLDTLISTRWIGEDWDELERLVRQDESINRRDEILALLSGRNNYILDALEAEIKTKYPEDYKYMLNNLYPKLRAVSFKYDLRRVGMIQDTIHTTVPDTLYARGVRLLQERKYYDALQILGGFYDRNTAVCLLSLCYDQRAYQTLKQLPETATNCYLLAISCARLERKDEALQWFDKSVELNANMRYRGNLDPEIAELLKERENEKNN